MQLERFFRVELVLAVALLAALTPAAAIVNFAFAPICAVMAIALMRSSPTDYISFTYWVWMLTPLIRRVVDDHSAFHETSLVMTAPLLVTGISGLVLFFRSPVRTGAAAIPYFIFVAVVCLGFIVGAVTAGITAALYDFLNWSTPAIFAIYVLRAPLPAGRIADTIFKALIWGGLIVGIYGVYQYFFLPSWDSKWMIASNLRSIGTPVPRQVRVFGTLNSPGPYSSYMAACLLLAMDSRLRWKWFAAVPASLGLMLSLVRSAWGGFVVEILAVISWSAAKKRLRYLYLLGAAAVLIVPVIAVTPVGEALEKRFETLNNLDSDNSFLARRQLYEDFTSQPLARMTGVGLAHSGVAGKQGDLGAEAASIDSGLIEIFFTFGLSGVFMLGAIALIAVRSLPRKQSPASVAAWSVAIGALSSLLFGNSLVGAPGMLVLPFFALALRCAGAARAVRPRPVARAASPPATAR